MRLLLFSDLHLDTPFAWAGRDLARVRRQALRDTLVRVCRLADELEVDALVSAGDLYEHERFSPDTGEFLRTQFAALGRPVLLAPGNHDWYGPGSLYTQVSWSPNVHVFAEDRLQPRVLTEGFTVWGAAHRAPANTDGFLDDFTVDRSGVNVGLFHGSERSALPFQESGKVPHAPFSGEQVARAGLAHAMLGHFHTPRDAETHTYPGNPDPLSFGESGERAAVLLEFAGDGSVRRERHRVASTTVADVDVRLDGPTTFQQVREQVVAELAPLSGVVRMTLRGEVAPEVDLRLADLRDVAPHLEALVPRLGQVHVTYDFDAIKEERTVRGQFVTDVLADEALDEPTRRRVLVTGLRALDGRTQELEVH